jgi:hypothetical protein
VPPLQPYIHRNPSGNSCASCCPKEEWIIRSAVKSSPHSRLPSLQQAHRGSPLRLRLLWRMAEEGCSATTLPRRRHEWIEAGVMDALERIALASKAIGSSACRWPMCASMDVSRRLRAGARRRAKARWTGGREASKAPPLVDANGIPLAMVAAGANPHHSPLLAATLDAAREASIELAEHASVHLDRAYDSKVTGGLLESRALVGVISEKGKPAPLRAGLRWVVERTNSWQNAHKKLAWCTEREDRTIGFWISFSNVIIHSA